MDEIEIVEYDPRWPTMFVEEVSCLRQAFDPHLLLGVEHFGSTAIPGMAAKPIIDILVAVRLLAEARTKIVEPLKRLGYVFWTDNPKIDRLFFVKGMPPYGTCRTHHVHITEPTGEMWSGLAFRDYLRTHADEARRYELLKRDLAMLHRTDREAYTNAKAAFIEDIRAKAGRKEV